MLTGKSLYVQNIIIIFKKLDFIKIKNLCLLKVIMKKTNRPAKDWEKNISKTYV